MTRTPTRSTRPVFFSAPEIRALLDGGKTQDRTICVSPSNLESPSRPGDLLWLREPYGLQADVSRYASSVPIFYRATDEQENVGRWAAAIRMPRGYSRLTLELTGSRKERLQDITEADAVAEGFRPDTISETRAAIDQFRAHWCEKHGADSWDANPLVRVREFRVHDRNVDELLGRGQHER